MCCITPGSGKGTLYKSLRRRTRWLAIQRTARPSGTRSPWRSPVPAEVKPLLVCGGDRSSVERLAGALCPGRFENVTAGPQRSSQPLYKQVGLQSVTPKCSSESRTRVKVSLRKDLGGQASPPGVRVLMKRVPGRSRIQQRSRSLRLMLPHAGGAGAKRCFQETPERRTETRFA